MKHTIYLIGLLIALCATESTYSMHRALQAAKPFIHTFVNKAQKPLFPKTKTIKKNNRTTLLVVGLITGTGITAHQMEEKWRVHKEDLEKTNKSDELELLSQKIALHIDKYSPHEILELAAAERSFSHPSVIMSAVAANIDTFLYTWDAENLLEILWRCQKPQKRIIAKAIANNIDKFLTTWKPTEITELLHVCDKHNRRTICSTIAGNINTLLYTWDARIIREILKMSDEQNKRHISSAIAINIISLAEKMNGLDIGALLEECTEQDKEAAISNILANKTLFLSKWHPIEIGMILSSCSQGALKELIVQEAQKLLNGQGVSQSDSHLKENARTAMQYIITIHADQSYRSAINQALTFERTMVEDFAVFYHSQRSHIFWLELLYTKLWQEKYNQKFDNYLFTRFFDDQNPSTQETLQQKGISTRKYLLEKGCTPSSFLYTHLLFTNYALFGNSNNEGSCCIHYLIQNRNCNDPAISSENIFSNLCNETLYQKYKSEINTLEEEFKEIVPGSVLLQIALPHDILKDYVYLAADNGDKKKLTIDGEQTDDLNAILHTLKTNPAALSNSDQQEFCIILTPDAVHTLREKGTEIHAFGAYDTAKFNLFIVKLEALIKRIVIENPNEFSAKRVPTQGDQASTNVISELVNDIPKHD